MKRTFLLCLLTFCSILFACDKKENDPAPLPVKPIPDLETISATIEGDGSITLTGKINKVDLDALDQGFIATLDGNFGPTWKILEMNKKPIIGTYTLNFIADTRFEKGKKYYFSATVKYPNLKYKHSNIMTFIVPE